MLHLQRARYPVGGGYTLWICLGLSFRFDCSFSDIYLICTICVVLARSAQSVSCVDLRGTASLVFPCCRKDW
jgi:hypothetical protein